MQSKEDQKKEFQLIDLPKDELKQIRYMFEKGRIPFFKNLLVQLMKRTRELPDKLTKLFGSYIKGEMSNVSWEIFLQVLEEEVNSNDLKPTVDVIDYNSKTIFLKNPVRKNLSEPPTKFFHPQYTLDFCEFIEVEGFKVSLAIINHSTLAVMDTHFTQLHTSVDFSRDFQKHALGQLHKKKLLDEKKRKEESMKKLRMSRLSSLMGDSENEKKEEGIKYEFDVILYAGLKKPKKKQSRRRRKRNYTRERRGTVYSEIDEDFSSTFESEFRTSSKMSRRKSQRSRNPTEDSFIETHSQKSHISSRTRLGTGSKKKTGGFSDAVRIMGERNSHRDKIEIQNTTFHSRQNTPKSRGTQSQLGQSGSKQFQRLNTGGLPSLPTSKKRTTNHKYLVANSSASSTTKNRRLSRLAGIPRQQETSNSRRMSRSYLLQGLSEKAAITNLMIELKTKLKKGDENRERMLYNEKEKKEIKRTFEKFKVIVGMKKNPSSRESKSVIHQNSRTRGNRIQKTSKSFHKKSKNSQIYEDDSQFKDLDFDDFEEYKKKLNEIIQNNKANRLWRAIGDFK